MIAARSVAIAAALGLLACQSAFAAEPVIVRATEHGKDGFGRIAFIWPAPVRYEARLEGTVLTIRFARPMTAKLDAIPKHLGAYVSSVRLRHDNATVVARVARGATLRSFASGNTVAIDIALTRRRRTATVEAPAAVELVPPPELIEPAAGAPSPAAGALTARLPADKMPGRRRGDDGAIPSADTSCGRRGRA